MPPSELDGLIADYRKRMSTMSQRELAHAEAKIWKLAKASKKIETRAGKWFQETFSTKNCFDFEIRQTVVNMGLPGEAFWKAMDAHGVTIYSAYDALRRVRGQIKQTSAEFSSHLHEEMKRCAASRRYKPASRPVRPTPPPSPSANEPEKQSPRTSSAPRDEAGMAESKTFCRDMRERAEAFIRGRCEGASEEETARVVSSFAVEMDVLLGDFCRRARLAREHGSSVATTQLNLNIRAACNRLDIPCAIIGKEFDFNAAKKKYRRLAASLHPDRHNGNPAVVKQYNDVNEAWETVVKWWNIHQHDKGATQ